MFAGKDESQRTAEGVEPEVEDMDRRRCWLAELAELAERSWEVGGSEAEEEPVSAGERPSGVAGGGERCGWPNLSGC